MYSLSSEGVETSEVSAFNSHQVQYWFAATLAEIHANSLSMLGGSPVIFWEDEVAA